MDKAMIFAAGLGTRLKPLTDQKPKALVELAGKSLLQFTIDKLTRFGIRTIVINIHHFPDLMRTAINALETHAEVVISDESDLLRDTGGGLLKASKYLEGESPFLVHNVDVISDISFDKMYEQHTRSGAMATLAVCNRKTSRYFLWHKNRLCGWKNMQTGDQITSFSTAAEPEPLAFSGIHIISPRIFEYMTENGIFSINKVYLRLAARHPIVAYRHNPDFWADVGTPEKLQKAQEMVHNHPEKF